MQAGAAGFEMGVHHEGRLLPGLPVQPSLVALLCSHLQLLIPVHPPQGWERPQAGCMELQPPDNNS